MKWTDWGNTAAKRRVWKNFFSLSVLQALSYLLPLLTIPYLFRVLGAEQFGVLALATATVGYLALLIDYGFNWSATKQVALVRDNSNELALHVSGLLQTKLLLIFCATTLMSVSFLIDAIRLHLDIYWLSFLAVVLASLMPAWFFQGMEEMRHILLANVVSRLIFTGLIFVFVHTEQDAWLVPLVTALGSFFALFYVAYIMLVKYKISFSLSTSKQIIYYLQDGWGYFTANLAISLYTISNVFILGMFASPAVVGYYSAAERLIRAIQNLFVPASQAIFPYVVKKTEVSIESGVNFLKKMLLVSSIIMLVLGAVVWLLSEPIALLVYGDKGHSEIALLLGMLAFIPLLVTISNIFGIQMMLNLGYKKEFNAVLWGSGVLGIGASLVFVPAYQDVATASILLLVEVVITLSMFLFLRFKRII